MNLAGRQCVTAGRTPLTMLDGFARVWDRVLQSSERTLVSIQAFSIPGLIRMKPRPHANRFDPKQHEVEIEKQEVEQLRLKDASVLLNNFQQIFSVSDAWIGRFAHTLNTDKKLVLFFVDLDNVPRFFKTFTIKVLQQIERRTHCETFVVCSSCQPYELKRVRGGNENQEHLSRVHFTLANKHKDSADAVITVAHAKLDSLLVASGRQQDARAIICSEDQIFKQVDDLLRRGSSLSAIASKVQVARPGNLFGLKLWQCECGRIFSSECAIEQHRGASQNPRCMSEASDHRDSAAGSQRLIGGGANSQAPGCLEGPHLLRRHRSHESAQATGSALVRLEKAQATRPRVVGRRATWRARSPINETLKTLAAFLTTTLSRSGDEDSL